MTAWLRSYRPHIVIVVTRTLSVVLFVTAGGILASNYLPLLEALLVGTIGGGVLGAFADQAAVAYGKRIERIDAAEHRARQFADRLDEKDKAPRNAAPTSGLTGAAVTGAALAGAVNRSYAGAGGPGNGAPRHALSGNGSRLVDGRRDARMLSQAASLVKLRGLMNATLRPEELIGQNGRGVIQLAAELSDQVPNLDSDTVLAYISDHVLVAAGMDPASPRLWHDGLLGGVDRLRTPVGMPPLDGVGLEKIDGLERALPAAGEELPGLLETIVGVIQHSHGPMDAARIGVCLNAKGYQVGPFTLVAACRRLVDQGRLEKTFGQNSWQLSDQEIAGLVKRGELEAAPLEHVRAALREGPLAGMSKLVVAVEVERRQGRPTSRYGVYAALGVLRTAGEAVRIGVEDGGRWQLVDPTQGVAGPGRAGTES